MMVLSFSLSLLKIDKAVVAILVSDVDIFVMCCATFITLVGVERVKAAENADSSKSMEIAGTKYDLYRYIMMMMPYRTILYLFSVLFCGEMMVGSFLLLLSRLPGWQGGAPTLFFLGQQSPHQQAAEAASSRSQFCPHTLLAEKAHLHFLHLDYHNCSQG